MADWHAFLKYAAGVAQEALDRCPSPARRQGYFLTLAGPAYAIWRDPTIVPEDCVEALSFSDKALIAAGRLLELSIEQHRHETLDFIWRVVSNPRRMARGTRDARAKTFVAGIRVPPEFAKDVHEALVERGALLSFSYQRQDIVIPICEDAFGNPIMRDDDEPRVAIAHLPPFG